MMAKLSNVGAPLEPSEEASIDEALVRLKAYVAAIDPGLAPCDLTAVIFKVNDHAYGVKDAIDKAFRAANTRMWHGNVRPFNRGVNPLSQVATSEQATQLRARGIHSKEDLNAALIELGLMPKK